MFLLALSVARSWAVKSGLGVGPGNLKKMLLEGLKAVQAEAAALQSSGRGSCHEGRSERLPGNEMKETPEGQGAQHQYWHAAWMMECKPQCVAGELQADKPRGGAGQVDEG
jgi:hypothetical protein